MIDAQIKIRQEQIQDNNDELSLIARFISRRHLIFKSTRQYSFCQHILHSESVSAFMLFFSQRTGGTGRLFRLGQWSKLHGLGSILRDQILTMNSDYTATFPEAERVYARDDGQDFECHRGLTIGASEPLTDNYSSGQHDSPDHTLVYNAVYQSCRDLTACGSWDEIHSSTPNRKSISTMHGMHLKNLSTPSINQSIIEYVPSCISHKVDIPLSPPKCIRFTGTSFPDIPTTSQIYPPDALLTTDQHLSTGSPSIYIPLTTLGRSVNGNVFAAQLKDNPDNKIYTLKTIPKVQRGVAEVTKELEILRFITDASLSNKPFPFLQKLKENFQDEKNLFIVLVILFYIFFHIFLTSVLLPGIFPDDIGEH